MSNFKQMPCDPQQLVIFPTSLDDAIPKGSDVRLLSEAMDALDWSAFESRYSKVGCPAYPPRVMAKILIYAYSKGLRSSRALEETIKYDKRYIWLAGGLEPDHATLSRFRKQHLPQLKELFRGTIALCLKANLVGMSLVSVDGSKIHASSSKKALYNKKRLDKEMEAIERIFQEAEQADREEDARLQSQAPAELPEELADAKKRKQKLKELAQRLADEKRTSISATEEECRVMKTSQGLRPAYNLQAAVDCENNVILAMDLSDHAHDSGLLSASVEQVAENTGQNPDLVLADTGYCDEASCLWLQANQQDALIPPQSKKSENPFDSSNFQKCPDRNVLICPAGRELPYKRTNKSSSGRYRVYTCSDCQGCEFASQCITAKKAKRRSVYLSVVHEFRKQMRERLSTEDGKQAYSNRQQSVELVFARIKTHMKLDRYCLHGKSGAHIEALLACIAHNLKVYTFKSCRLIAFFFRKRRHYNCYRVQPDFAV